MIEAAIEKIRQLVLQKENLPLIEVVPGVFDGTTTSYTHKVKTTAHGRELGEVIQPPRPAALEVSTLTGFVDAIRAGVAGSLDRRVIHVEDYLKVTAKNAYPDIHGFRDTVLRATHKPLGVFNFGDYYSDPEKFIIALQAGFYMNDDAVYVQRVASGLAAVHGAVGTQDDGFSQQITVKRGEVRTSEVQVKPRIKLIPRRTFDEAAPVESEFLLRLKQAADGMPSIAIFSVDGTKWQGECMQSIKDWLGKNLPAGVSIIA